MVVAGAAVVVKVRGADPVLHDFEGRAYALVHVGVADVEAVAQIKMGVEQEIVSADRFASMVKADYERYRSIVQSTGFKASLEDQFK